MIEKLFKITKNNSEYIYIYIYILFVEIKFKKKNSLYKFFTKFIKFKNKNFKKQEPNKIDIKEWLQKYKYVFDKNIEYSATVPGYENTIWTCWFQGINTAPRIIKKTIKTIKKYNQNLQIIIITEKNFNQYIKLPTYIKQKLQCNIIDLTHLSDYLRVSLLQKYGGTWIDCTCFFTNKIPKEILDSSFFQFVNYDWFLLKEVPSINVQNLIYKLRNIKLGPTGSNWFLHAKPNNPIINRTKQLLEEYWKKENSLTNYFIFHCLLTFAVENDEICRKEFEKMPLYNNIYPFLLPEAFDYKFDEKIYKEIVKNSFVHKLNYKDLKKKKYYNSWIKNIFKNLH